MSDPANAVTRAENKRLRAENAKLRDRLAQLHPTYHLTDKGLAALQADKAKEI